jgi:hypothetical protein
MRISAHSRSGRAILLIAFAYILAFQGFAGALAGASHGAVSTPAAHCAPSGTPDDPDRDALHQGLCCVLGHWPATPALPPVGYDLAPVRQAATVRLQPPRVTRVAGSVQPFFAARAPPALS